MNFYITSTVKNCSYQISIFVNKAFKWIGVDNKLNTAIHTKKFSIILVLHIVRYIHRLITTEDRKPFCGHCIKVSWPKIHVFIA